jgi:hypothetical protein
VTKRNQITGKDLELIAHHADVPLAIIASFMSGGVVRRDTRARVMAAAKTLGMWLQPAPCK